MSTNRYDVTAGKTKNISEANLLYISSAKYGGDWHSSPHSHQCTELFYVTGGKGGFNIENEVFQVKTHDLVVVNPNVQHTETSWNFSPLEYIVLGVEGLELSNPDSTDDRYFVLQMKNVSDVVIPCLNMMIGEVEHKKPGADSICQNLLQVLIVHLMREARVSAEKTERATRRECGTAKWYIDSHFKEKITLNTLAEICGVNKYYLSHSFSQEYGISPIQYLIHKRLEESKYLLRSTDIPIARIVQTLGFSSGSYFAQMFRNAEGLSPSDYRQQRKTNAK